MSSRRAEKSPLGDRDSGIGPRFGISVLKRGVGVVVAFSGELDLAVADQMQATIDSVDESALVIDLAACEFIDSTGIAVIVRAHNRFAEEGRKLVISSPRQQVLRVLEVTGLTSGDLLVGDPDEVLA